MRTALLFSLLLHTGAVAAAWQWHQQRRTEPPPLDFTVRISAEPALAPVQEPPPFTAPEAPSPRAEERNLDIEPIHESDDEPPMLDPVDAVPVEAMESAETVETVRGMVRAVRLLRPLTIPGTSRTPDPAPAPVPTPVPAAAHVQPAPRPAPTTPPRILAGKSEPVPYPPRAQREGLTGRVLLRVRVGADGSVAELSVSESSGHGILDRAALATVRHWRFEPARREGRAIPFWIRVPIRFRFTGSLSE